MNINDYKIIRITKWLLFYILSPIIRLEYKIWDKFVKKKKIIRFFSTSGNISLVNILSIINEIGNFDKYEDYLFIDTGKGRKDFIENQMEIASLHNFKKIYIGYQVNSGIIAVLNNFFKVDEVYLLNHNAHLKTVLKLYTNAKITLIDEGPASLINYGIENIKNLKEIKMHKYLGKLDFYGINNIQKYNFNEISMQEFNKIREILSKKYPININYDTNEKYILYCSIYWEVSGLNKDEFSKVQKKVIQDLVDKGYKILYKPHPRDSEFYGFDRNPNVKFIDSKYPIELYEFDVVAIVSISSTSSLTLAHYSSIPCFSHVTEKAINHTDEKGVKLDIVKHIVKEYSPDYSILLNFDISNTSKQELKETLNQYYKTFLKTKPLLSENKRIGEKWKIH